MMDLTNVLPLVLALGVVALATGCFAPGARAACRARRPLRLRCEYRDDPLGIDAKAPRLSWEVDDERRGAVQTAYQIVVADKASDLSRNRGTVWNSGKVLSGETVGVAYGGAALKTGRRYYWKVRTWDGADRPSAYSAPAFWEMGLLRPADWKARWITTTEEEITVRLGQWIWHPGATKRRHTVYLRKFFEVPRGAKIERAVIWMTADESYTVYLNGNRVGQHGDWDRLHDG
ncbi:MAG: hypothetical protein QF662_04125, partial [Phycisphaerae bacterium]|nr:hypothetical protein [Phycisphaerae bacterium]